MRTRTRQLEPINPLLALGAHVITRRVGYTHHGLYVGDGKVLEYIKDKGVITVTLDTFTQGHELFIREHKNARYQGKEAVRRGMMRLGEQHYNLLTRNCEHFVNWCIDGVESSRQIDNLILTIIPFYALFQKSDFVRGCLRVIYDDPYSLDKALARIDWHQALNQNPATRAQELSEDIFGTQNEGVVSFATLFTTAAQLSEEYSSWLKDQIEQEKRLKEPHPQPPSQELAPFSAFRNKHPQLHPTLVDTTTYASSDTAPKGKWQQLKENIHSLLHKLRQKLSGLPIMLELLPGTRPIKDADLQRLMASIPNIHIKLDPSEVHAIVATPERQVSYHAPYQRPLTRSEANELAFHIAEQIEQELRAQYELRSDEPKNQS